MVIGPGTAIFTGFAATPLANRRSATTTSSRRRTFPTIVGTGRGTPLRRITLSRRFTMSTPSSEAMT